MSAHCGHHEAPAFHKIANLARYRRVLWVALAINLTMFFIEISSGVALGSLSLLADAIDFAGDTLNYGISLAVLAAAASVFGSGTAWPDLAVASVVFDS